MAVTAEVVSVNPQMAALWLQNNHDNYRKLDDRRVTLYAADMSQHNWALNGEAIIFSANGTLLDGQHRLHAVIRSGVAVLLLVVRGVETDAMHIDRGMSRSVSQWLRHRNIKNAALIASMSRYCLAHEHGKWSSMAYGSGTLTDSQIIDFAMQYHQAMNNGMVFTKTPGLSRNILNTILFIGSGFQPITDNSIACWFRDSLITGEDLGPCDAVLHLRNRLANSRGPNKLTSYVSRMLVTLAWNKTVLEEPCRNLRLVLSGPTAMKPPNEVLVAHDHSIVNTRLS